MRYRIYTGIYTILVERRAQRARVRAQGLSAFNDNEEQIRVYRISARKLLDYLSD